MARLSRYFAVITVFVLNIYSSSYAGILVIAPHPDDDVLTSAGIIHHALSRGQDVKVVYLTNGDNSGISTGLTRQEEAVAAQSELGLTEDNLIFLGYPDGYLGLIFNIYPALTDQYTTPNGQAVTYGNRGLGRVDYHSHRFGAPAAYNRANMVIDLQDVIETFQPEHIYTVSEHDTHQDHASTYDLTALAVTGANTSNPAYIPAIHTTVVWTADPGVWPAVQDPTSYHTESVDFAPAGLIWSERESLDVPISMQSTDFIENLKYQAINRHTTQGGASGFLGRFVHKDEIYWATNEIGSNRPPTVEAGASITVAEGTAIQLDGSASFDLDIDPLTFQWEQVGGLSVSLSDPTVAAPNFIAPSGITEDEILSFELIVNDGTFNSSRDLVSITVLAPPPINYPPIANAGNDQTVGMDIAIQLDGSGSSDPNGELITYQWTQVDGTPIALSDPTVVNPTLRTPTGLATDEVLTFELVTHDGAFSSTADQVDILVQLDGPSNIAPLATATASSEGSSSQTADKSIDEVIDGYPGDASREWATAGERTGAWLTLSWGRSYEVDRVVLYDRPNVSDQVNSAVLSFSDGSSINVGPLDNVGGAYVATFAPRLISELTVTVTGVSLTTGGVGLAEIEVVGTLFEGSNLPPVSDAGIDQNVGMGIPVQLDGSGSSDPNGDPITFFWAQTSGTPIVLSDATTANPIFSTPTGLIVDEVLSFELTVDDGLVSTTDQVDITVQVSAGVNIAPLAVTSASSENPGQPVTSAIDGIIDGFPGDASREWATAGEGAGAWLDLNWGSAYVVDRIVLYDRPNLSDQVTSATLTFSDGTRSTLTVGPLDNAGGVNVYTFAPKVTTSLIMTINSVLPGTNNAGLAEIEVIGVPYTGNNAAPTAAAGTNQTVGRGIAVQLDGTGSIDPDDNPLTYQWTQIAGPLVILSDTSTATPTFKTPANLTQDEIISFELVVNDGDNNSTPDQVDISVLLSAGSNIAPVASVTASSETVNTGQIAQKTIDGVIDGYPGDATREWASDGENAGAWITLDWGSSTYVVDRVVLYDRINLFDHISSATLNFSDGSSIVVGPLNNAGEALVTTFSPRMISSMTINIDNTSVDTQNIGLAEIEIAGIVHTGQNLAPIANAGDNQTVDEGTITQLNGTSSSDLNGDPLTYSWSQVGGIPVMLSDATMASPIFTSPSGLLQNEVLSFELVVNDGQLDSIADNVTVLTQISVGSNVAPLATATASSESTEQTANNAIDNIIDGYPGDAYREWASAGQGAGAWINLNWGRSYTIDRIIIHDRPNLSDQITSATLTFSDGSSIDVGALDNTGAGYVITFTPKVISSMLMTIDTVGIATDNIGLAEIQVIGTPFNGGNLAPTALAGIDQTTNTSTLIQLDGSASSDPNGDMLTYQWTQVSGPLVTLSDPNMVNPIFTTPSSLTNDVVVGFELVVNDGLLNSFADQVNIYVNVASSINIAPLALSVAASSESGNRQAALKAIDGIIDGYPNDLYREWATADEGAGAWITLTWDSAYIVDSVTLYDRINLFDQITNATLTFSDGSSVAVGTLDNSGAGLVVSFPPREITSLTLTIDSVSIFTGSVGLAEVEVTGTSP